MSLSEALNAKIFNHVHGNNLVYNICWEDPRIDHQMLNLSPADNVMVITSAGCNALDYILKGCNHVYAVDMNYRQNAVLDLKKAAAKLLDYENYWQLLGEGWHPDAEKLYKEVLRDALPFESRDFWDKKIYYFKNRKCTYYWHGTSGYFAHSLNRYINFKGCRQIADQLLEARTLDEQKECYEKLEKKFWTSFIRWALNRNTTLALLGVPKSQRIQVETQYNGQISLFMKDCLEAVFCKLPISDNYFWRVYLTGHFTKDCCPEYLKEENFLKLKNGLADKVTTYSMSVEQFLRKPELSGGVKISRFILLDHMDWLANNHFEWLVSEWESILERAADQTRILWRSGGYRTDFLEKVEIDFGKGVKEKITDHFQMHEEETARLHELDRVHTYGSFHVADLIR
ncbi:MAG: BtaA family protein [Thermoguttaceae bacterium]|nr:BtaA family protein [Thermoguttaceae bacterium]MDO4859209.1 BtaA family protein [Thermoguttaceae bacterium]